MNRRTLLLGSSATALAVSRALAQPLPVISDVAPPRMGPGPLWTGGPLGVPPGASLDLSFMNPGTLDPRITFTRASTATYTNSAGVIQAAATNAPRWDYNPATLALNGLLIEEARQNTWLQSADASNAAWGKSGGTVAAPVVTGNQTTAPDGTLTAASVVYPAVSGGGAYSNISQTIAATTQPASFTVWLKGAVGGEQVYLNTTADAVTYYRTLATLTTAWQRFSLVTSALTATAWYWQIGTDLRDAGQSSKPAQTVYVWGGQVEIAPFPSSYIPTAAAAVTRAADIPTMLVGAPWFNSSIGTVECEFIAVNVPSAGSQGGMLRMDDGTDANLVSVFSPPSSSAVLLFGGVASVAMLNAVPASITGAPQKAAVAYGAPQWNGAASSNWVAGIGGATPLPATRLLFGMSNATPAWWLNGWLRRVRYWPRMLSVAEMQQVTT